MEDQLLRHNSEINNTSTDAIRGKDVSNAVCHINMQFKLNFIKIMHMGVASTRVFLSESMFHDQNYFIITK